MNDVIQKAVRETVDWMNPGRDTWEIDLAKLRLTFERFDGLEWLQGKTTIRPEIERRDFFGKETISLEGVIYKEAVLAELPKKIFLSHKGANKPMVRRFDHALKAIGYDTWLDEDAMPAGTYLERGLLQGFEDSCAAVFFLTPQFADEGFLATEIDYAIAEKRKKGDRFAIITLLFAQEGQRPPKVPGLLAPFVWKEPATELDALRETVRALPLTTEIKFRSGSVRNENENRPTESLTPSTQFDDVGTLDRDLIETLVILSKQPYARLAAQISEEANCSVEVIRFRLDQLNDSKFVETQPSGIPDAGDGYCLSRRGRAYLHKRGLLE